MSSSHSGNCNCKKVRGHFFYLHLPAFSPDFGNTRPTLEKWANFGFAEYFVWTLALKSFRFLLTTAGKILHSDHIFPWEQILSKFVFFSKFWPTLSEFFGSVCSPQKYKKHGFGFLNTTNWEFKSLNRPVHTPISCFLQLSCNFFKGLQFKSLPHHPSFQQEIPKESVFTMDEGKSKVPAFDWSRRVAICVSADSLCFCLILLHIVWRKDSHLWHLWTQGICWTVLPCVNHRRMQGRPQRVSPPTSSSMIGTVFAVQLMKLLVVGSKWAMKSLPTLKHLAISGTFLFSWQPFLYIPAFELEKMGIFVQQHFARK